jgi:hypothetical protein
VQISQCRACGSDVLVSLAGGQLLLCRSCGLVQAAASAPPNSRRHAAGGGISETLLETHPLGENSFVVEIGSHDGRRLRPFVDRAIPVLGIEDDAATAASAREAGIATVGAQFGREIAGALAASGRRADLIIVLDALERAADPDDFAAGLAALLGTRGQIVLEFAYLRDLVEAGRLGERPPGQVLWLSLTALEPLFERHGIHLNDARRRPAARRLRVTASHEKRRTPRLVALLAAEASLPLGEMAAQERPPRTRRPPPLRDAPP